MLSLGIGTYFIQFANSVKQEEKLKKLNEIPSSERIAVILYAAYNDNKSIFCMSPRKDFEEYFTLHKWYILKFIKCFEIINK